MTLTGHQIIPYDSPDVDAFDFGIPDFLTSWSHELGDVFKIPKEEFGKPEWFEKAVDWVLAHSAKYLVFETLYRLNRYLINPLARKN